MILRRFRGRRSRSRRSPRPSAPRGRLRPRDSFAFSPASAALTRTSASAVALALAVGGLRLRVRRGPRPFAGAMPLRSASAAARRALRCGQIAGDLGWSRASTVASILGSMPRPITKYDQAEETEQPEDLRGIGRDDLGDLRHGLRFRSGQGREHPAAANRSVRRRRAGSSRRRTRAGREARRRRSR